jgi:CheY-like chemotaxis protein
MSSERRRKNPENRPLAQRLIGSARERIGFLNDRRSSDRPLRILLVDDAPVNLAAFCRFLGRMGCEVDPVSSGEYAVAFFTEGCDDARYDLVLMDLNMPGLDGLDTTRRIRSVEAGLPESHPYRERPVPILALTTKNPGKRLDDCRKAGMNDFMYKPFEPEVLREALARWVPVPA